MVKRRGRDSPAARSTVGQLPSIEGYLDLEVIGRGASATVYRATQVDLSRTVAIKLLHIDMSDRRAQRRFAREKAINGLLSNHPNVVTVFDTGFVDGRSPYLVMEYFARGSLTRRLGERGPFTVAETLHIGVRMAGALASAHELGVLHRDVKPQNILFSSFGEPALADFGIATILELEQSMTSSLTPVHAAPELLENAEPSPSSDVYALGSTLYTLLSGAPPFAGPPGEGVLAQLLRISTMELPALHRPDVPASLIDALRAATAKRPEARTATAAELGRALQAVQRELGLGVSSLPIEHADELSAPAPATPSSAPPAQVISSTPFAPPSPAEAVVRPVPVAGPDDQPTVDAPDGIGAMTMTAHQRRPESVPSARRRRAPLIAGGAAVLAVAAGVGGVALLRDSSSGQGAATTTVRSIDTVSTSTVPTSTVPTSTVPVPTVLTTLPTTTLPASTSVAVTTSLVDVAAHAVTGVTVSVDDDVVVVRWANPPGTNDNHLVQIQTPDGALTPQLAGRDLSMLVLDGVDAGTPLCVQVASILDLTGDGPTQALSEVGCINGAYVVSPADGSVAVAPATSG